MRTQTQTWIGIHADVVLRKAWPGRAALAAFVLQLPVEVQLFGSVDKSYHGFASLGGQTLL